MFSLGKVSVVLEKSTALVGIGLIAAVCGCIMLKSGIEKLINGGGTQDANARYKGILLTAIASGLIFMGLVTILEAELLLKLLSKQIHQLLEVSLS
ncbi:MAG TPA: hypothetical protein VFF04_07045 [Candidatus Babeliales bacterium]|nr:hypothetical protein [Candidatus Babeliales bacterium]